ncbi:peptide chain release factor 2 [Wenzhouxiangella sediminis]|uniref:Peptide chain release factor 2 n=1 Tax=Wenzhouxiangella sediminis TaxID=1792836 RepID=A0A3E1KBF5_9GAMM|nr:peptide chain release factor 2 [Wenzhouxiangella sediminis]RFF31948.1 peptide chain release factor 2 [Wenzhouxiangella sediminis]
MELTAIKNLLDDLERRVGALRGYLDYDGKVEKLEEVTRELEVPSVWDDPEHAQKLGKERSDLDRSVTAQREVIEGVRDAADLLELAQEEDDEETLESVAGDLQRLEKQVADLEFRRMFSGEMDDKPCFIDIQAGSGGTEAQDWAEMLLRMYLRWAEHRGWKTELIEVSEGDVAGIKSATVRVEGDHAFGWCRTETGVHRLVRKSPFDSGNRRHTSFASVFVSPEIDDSIEVDIDPSDLRVDVYRASGAGGQHVNRTESAVRITHEPSGIVVQCQTDRSQHKNKDQAMKQLRAKLYELELQKQREKAQAAEEEKADIGWGSQIRNYVLDQSRIKDLRTGVERSDTQKVLDGDLDEFAAAQLQAGLE